MKCNIPICLQKEKNCFYEHHIQQSRISNINTVLKGFSCSLKFYCDVTYIPDDVKQKNTVSYTLYPYVIQDTISLLFSHFITVISERDTSVPEVPRTLRAALKKMNMPNYFSSC